MRDLLPHQPPVTRRRAPPPSLLGACSAVLYGGNKLKSYRTLYKALGSKAGYGGHFRAVQGFKYIGGGAI